MNIADFALMVAKYGAPILGSLLGSGMPIVGTVVSLIASHFGTSNKLDEIAQAIIKNPNALRELEFKHQEAIVNAMINLINESKSVVPGWIMAIVILLFSTSVLLYFGCNMLDLCPTHWLK